MEMIFQIVYVPFHIWFMCIIIAYICSDDINLKVSENDDEKNLMNSNADADHQNMWTEEDKRLYKETLRKNVERRLRRSIGPFIQDVTGAVNHLVLTSTISP